MTGVCSGGGRNRLDSPCCDWHFLWIALKVNLVLKSRSPPNFEPYNPEFIKMTILAVGLLSAVAGCVATIACGAGVVFFAGREEQKDLEFEHRRSSGASPVRYITVKAEGNISALPGGLQENL